MVWQRARSKFNSLLDLTHPVMAPALGLATFALLAMTVAAFWPTYVSKPLGSADGFTHFHAVMGAAWLLLVITQAHLINTRKFAAHRLIGRLSFLLAPAFVLSSVLLAHHRFSSMDSAAFESEAYTLYLPLSASALFAAAFSLAVIYRRTAPLHARFMACTALLLVDPVLGRIIAFHVLELPQFWHYQLITFSVELALLGVMARTLRPAAKAHVFSAFAATYAVILLLWFVAPKTGLWFAFAKWFRELPMT
jgi:hypothetical protein